MAWNIKQIKSISAVETTPRILLDRTVVYDYSGNVVNFTLGQKFYVFNVSIGLSTNKGITVQCCNFTIDGNGFKESNNEIFNYSFTDPFFGESASVGFYLKRIDPYTVSLIPYGGSSKIESYVARTTLTFLCGWD